MNRNQWKEFQDVFFAELAVTHVTMSTTQTVIVGPVDVYQIQVDTPPSDSQNYTLNLFIGSGSSEAFKYASIAGPGTREVTFMGRPLYVADVMNAGRFGGDTGELHLTVLYRPVP